MNVKYYYERYLQHNVRLQLTIWMSYLDIDLLRLLKVKFNGAIRLPMYGFLLMFNGPT